MRRKARNRTHDVATCRPRLTRWCATGSTPKSDTSSMCESQVSGCQLCASEAVSAQRTDSSVSPARTCAFPVTYTRSSQFTNSKPEKLP